VVCVNVSSDGLPFIVFFLFRFLCETRNEREKYFNLIKGNQRHRREKKEELSYWDKNKKEKKQTNCFISTNDFAYAMNQCLCVGV
jgi:hypothetical protein